MSTAKGQELVFGPFRLAPISQRLWKGEHAVQLEPQPLAVLQYLVEQAGRVVSKDELLREIWAGQFVVKAVVKECIRAIRKALDEDALVPRYIETRGREGYRFLSDGVEREETTALASSVSSDLLMVGRVQELAQLRGWLERALRGERQLVFVTGEPGIGKTALVDRFQERVGAPSQAWVGRGQCVEHYGEGEAYLPVLEALGDLFRQPGGLRLKEILGQYAPTWLVQLPALVSESERQALQGTVEGVTRERRLRELVDALEALSTECPVVLVFEDLHWSDPSTVELLSALAQRRQLARLLVLGTYRPADVVMGQHPLKGVKQELHAHGHCEELRLELLSAQHVTEYLARRFPQHQFPPELGAEIHRRTEGNALFMVNVIAELVTRARIVQDDGNWKVQGDLTALNIPDNVRQLIERQLEQLSEEAQEVLEVASVAGSEFAVAVVVAGLKHEAEAVEEICEDLAWQGHFVSEVGLAEWPDGTLSGKYAFRHALYQNVLYDCIAEARQVRLHRLIGERLETGYKEQTNEVAAELAVHFERGRDTKRAVQYLQQASQRAGRRSANKEAISYLTRGLELLKTLPDTPERVQQELTLQVALGATLMAAKGYIAPEVEKTYAQARELCRQVRDTPQLLPVLFGLFSFYSMKGEAQTATELAEQLMGVAQRVQDSPFLLLAHRVWGLHLYGQGKLTSALKHFEQVVALYNREQHHPLVVLSIMDSGVHCRAYAAEALWMLGYPEQALKRIQEALALAQELSHPNSVVYAIACAAIVSQVRREAPAVQEQAKTAIALSTEDGYPFLLPELRILFGWALVTQGRKEEGIAEMSQGLVAKRTMGAEGPNMLYFRAVLVEAYKHVGRSEEGLALLAEALALAESRRVYCFEADLYRLKGELTLQKFQASGSKFQVQPNQKAKSTNPQLLTPNPQAEAEACFHKAIEIAQRQQAKSLELRATMSLARLWQQQGKKTKARRMLAEIYGWFTEGFDTKDLQEAKTLLDELG